MYIHVCIFRRLFLCMLVNMLIENKSTSRSPLRTNSGSRYELSSSYYYCNIKCGLFQNINVFLLCYELWVNEKCKWCTYSLKKCFTSPHKNCICAYKHRMYQMFHVCFSDFLNIGVLFFIVVYAHLKCDRSLIMQVLYSKS